MLWGSTVLDVGTAISSAPVAALSSSTKMVEVVILAVVVILLGTILVLYRRNAKPAKASHAGSGGVSAASYYSDIGTLSTPGSMAGSFGGSPGDQFTGFGGGMEGFGGGMEQNHFSPPPPPPAPMTSSMPPPGTPANWLPDPGGAPDTLRYWDGANWTEHVAKRN